MNALSFRIMHPNEAARLSDIDRSERVEGVYRILHGRLELELEPALEFVPTWNAAELDAYLSRLEELQAAGGVAFGAWDESLLVGFASLDACPVGDDPSILRLDMLYVSASHRQRGIGRRLTELVASKARALGAAALYISATPTRSTVDLYRRLGADVLTTPDPVLLAREPEDVHLLLRLV